MELLPQSVGNYYLSLPTFLMLHLSMIGSRGPQKSDICSFSELIEAESGQSNCLAFPLLGIPHLLFCINPKDNGTLEEAYMIVNAFIKSSQRNLDGHLTVDVWRQAPSDRQSEVKRQYLGGCQTRRLKTLKP
ncbi:hypothetical protein CEXT_509901 [Caerostris extrusa]|uniref:Uncharacterized protein n=1 Tax=Caerostris extrusa TaxID=172846 RepID=A0AAV4NG55_CAEEX|nr:hypothetical protein CEXT_509901 [Caerostris extrusa]